MDLLKFPDTIEEYMPYPPMTVFIIGGLKPFKKRD